MSEENKALFAVIDDPKAPEIYASYLLGAAFDGPNVSITFCSKRNDHSTNSGLTNHVVNGRLVMSVGGARDMVAFLSDWLAKAELNATIVPSDRPMQ